MDLKALIERHSQSGPRYTSYPTAPVWKTDVTAADYKAHLASGCLTEDQTLGLYVHIPFCESLCYYCGCNIQITHDHSRSGAYVQALVRELETIASALGKRRALSQISWGGGTPTFLSLDEIRLLQETTLRLFDLAPGADVSIEIDPRVTSDDQLKLLRDLQFNRVSLGVQDFDEKVQKAVNRIQPAAMTEAMLKRARELGFKGINFDLIYGLPHQTLETFRRTVEAVVAMEPDRIALYNYARLPNMIKHQSILEDRDFPSASERVDIFTMAFEALTGAGYGAIGMDHFAHPTDALYTAIQEGTLYRNFMGYVVRKGTNLIGLGASAIGELGGRYFQNVRKAKEYEERVAAEGVGVFRGHTLSDDDKRRKWIIQTLMCRFQLDYSEYATLYGGEFLKDFGPERARLAPLEKDGFVVVGKDGITVTELGRLFIRNLAMVFDAYLQQPQGVTYSKTV